MLARAGLECINGIGKGSEEMMSPGGRRTYGKGSAKRNHESSRLVTAMVCMFVLAVVVVTTLFLVRRNNVETTTNTEQTINRRPKPREVTKTNVNAPVQPKQEQIPEQPQIQVRRYGRSSNVPTSDTNNIHYASKTGLRVTDADGNVRAVRSKPIFKSRADNMLWAAVRPGGMPSGLNALRSRMRFQTGSDEAFLQALRNQDITIEPDDPPHVVNAKKITIEVKQGIISELDKGRTFDDIYKEICTETHKERMYERIAQEDMRKIAKERDAAAMRKYVEDMNPVMQELGLRELRLPSWAIEEETTNN